MTMQSLIRRQACVRLTVLSLTVGAGALFSGCSGVLPSPTNELSTGQMMLDLSNAMVQLREDNAYLQAQIDSLRGAVAYQDTIIQQLGALANVSVRPPASSIP